jgi:poly(A) polymerase
MIRKLFSRIFRVGTKHPTGAHPTTLNRKQHQIQREGVSHGSRRTCEALQQAGFEAYVVGGAVRDLMLGAVPKDFDVATNATPEQVKRCFRRSRIIGRRFQIVHVYQGNEVIEVTTFRGSHDAKTDNHGRVLNDNVFGSMQEDAARRDFTVNALYYDPHKEIVVDYHQGVADISAQVLRMIGDPVKRYREDPVRMLRAVRLSAKLGLVIDPSTRAPIQSMGKLLENVPPARLFDEMLKLLTSGHAVKCLRQLRAEGLHHGLLPLLDVILEQPQGERFVIQALENTDARVHQGKPISPSFLFATLLWNEVLACWKTLKNEGMLPIPALYEAMDQVLDTQAEKLAITRRIAGDIKEIWSLQPRFQQRSGKRPYALLEHPRFRAAFDFLLLRGGAGELNEEDAGLPDWWTAFQNADGETRADLLQPDKSPAKRRRRRRKSADSPLADNL